MLSSAHLLHPPQRQTAAYGWKRPAANSTPADSGDAAAQRSCLIRLLVVDDDLGSIEYLGHLLKGFAQVSFATNGDDALRLAALQRPDLVLLDIELPGLHGFEVCRRMRATPALQGTPIIFATQHGDTHTEAEALQLGGDDFLRKPFDNEQVLARLRHQLRHRTAAATGRPRTPARPTTATMLSYIAHEMGNPINAINGFAQLMQTAPLPAGQAEKLSHILDAVGRLKGLLTDVTDMARMEAGLFQIDTAEIELGGFLMQACAAAQDQAEALGMTLTLPAPEEVVWARADARRLRQCLDNLLSNAMKYGRSGGRIEVTIEERGREVLLAVQDHGDGLSDSQLAHLFEPYNRLGRDRGAIPGTGLGLTLTRELVHAMGGHLEAHSDGPGQGSRFGLWLPGAG